MNQLLKKSLTQSKFQMWRGCFALIIIDGVISPEEKTWFEEKLKLIPFSDSEVQILKDDLKNATDIEEIIPLITSSKGFRKY